MVSGRRQGTGRGDRRQAKPGLFLWNSKLFWPEQINWKIVNKSRRRPELLSTLLWGRPSAKIRLSFNLSVKCNANISRRTMKGATPTCGHILHWYLRPLPPAGACPPPEPTPGPPILLALMGCGTTSSAAAEAAATALLWWCAAAAAAADTWLPWCEPPARLELPPPGPEPEPLTALPSPRLPVKKKCPLIYDLNILDKAQAELKLPNRKHL